MKGIRSARLSEDDFVQMGFRLDTILLASGVSVVWCIYVYKQHDGRVIMHL